jgi:hypothetical protein
MTVISTVITRTGTAHASDSLITEPQPDGTANPIGFKRSKILPVPRFRGAMSYWGLARYGSWNLYRHLQTVAANARDHPTPEMFADYIALEITRKLGQLGCLADSKCGVGIHFTAYEYINGYWIPELFIISNWTDPSYSRVFSTGLAAARKSYETATHLSADRMHGAPNYRLQVRDYLLQGGLFIWNNGDPTLFNSAANAILGMIRTASERAILADLSHETLCSIVRRPIEVVRAVQRDFYRPGHRLVGGKLHDLAIRPSGEYYSTTGDC